MFRKHPKELLPIMVVNMFAYFAYFTLMSVLILFLSEKSGLTFEQTSIIYSIFYFAIFILTFVGGFVADKTRNYKGTILNGLVLMAIGYIIIVISTISSQSWVFLTTISIALFLIALGSGLFHGNIQAILGQVYDDPNYSQMRDSVFLLSYLFLNIGVLFSPLAAVGIRDSWISHKGFVYESNLTWLCSEYIAKGKDMDSYNHFMNLAASSGQGTMEISEFATQYLYAFNTGFSFIFVLAAVVMVASIVIFFRNEKKFPTPAKLDFQTSKIDTKIIKQRVYALLAVFGVLNIFGIAFYQDGLTLTFFARDHTELRNWGIDFSKVTTFFVVLAIPIVLAIFSALRAKGREPSTLKKMGFGMGIAAIAYLVMMLGSIGLPNKTDLVVFSETQRVIPFLFGTYFILAIAQILVFSLLSSFISQFARPKHQGIMQSVCYLTTFIGNYLLFLGVIMYERIPIVATWLILATICLGSMIILLLVLKWIEKTMKNEADNAST
jgi:POT family proton-dependent oligopeptide transporter